jgi:hypothetical protein
MKINVDEGFLPKFSKDFLETYGNDSIFTYAVSDFLTHAVANMLRAHNRLVSEETVAYFGSEEAEVNLSLLVEAVDGTITLYQESCGILPIGSFAELVDSVFKEEIFNLWLKEFQNEKFDIASRILGIDI